MPIPADRYLLLIGAAKCGTTTLFQHLIGHPSIAVPSEKEPGFFLTAKSRAGGVEAYERLWNFDPALHRWALEASTGYSSFPFFPDVPESIHQFGIRPKLLYLVRDPIDRITSSVNFGIAMQWYGPDSIPPLDRFIDDSNYQLQIGRYLRMFPRESLLVLDHAELEQDPARLVRRITEYLEIEPIEVQPKLRHNPTRRLTRLEIALEQSRLRRLYRFVPMPVRTGLRRIVRGVSSPYRFELTESERGRIRAAVDLHWRLFVDGSDSDEAQTWQHSRPALHENLRVRIPSQTDLLLHVLEHGIRWHPIPPLRWVADAVMILRAGGVEWERFVSLAVSRNAVLPVREGLAYLQKELGAAVDDLALSDLARRRVSLGERLRYRENRRPYDLRRGAYLFWRRYRLYRRAISASGQRRERGVLRYCRRAWGTGSAAGIPAAIIGRARRLLRKPP
ncbi:MAG TPA: sulfotransferase domain-containing protein [Thermoanaerobaculia bacterium]|nr:sulfotransferase domain-containing protein [Thermoanaerobaculia bacterium]